MSKEQAEALLDYTKELKTAKGNGIGVQKRTREDSAALWKRIRGTDHFRGRWGTEILLHLPAIMYGEKKE